MKTLRKYVKHLGSRSRQSYFSMRKEGCNEDNKNTNDFNSYQRRSQYNLYTNNNTYRNSVRNNIISNSNKFENIYNNENKLNKLYKSK